MFHLFLERNIIILQIKGSFIRSDYWKIPARNKKLAFCAEIGGFIQALNLQKGNKTKEPQNLRLYTKNDDRMKCLQ
ncbi:hypothetical protein C9I99_19510 [Photobacterium lutimaris]|uniref:Uncharacterized protein n=1 Tax=Photobacterium lutimaris TaxID=388278 RepID=A0A2T3IUE4_9GAMM|nr:hypothetical protein C9I99_19510 [Photobacterium lutimaris]